MYDGAEISCALQLLVIQGMPVRPREVLSSEGKAGHVGDPRYADILSKNHKGVDCK